MKEVVFRSNCIEPLTSVDLNRNGFDLAIGTEDGNVYLYDMRNMLRPLVYWKEHDSSINHLFYGKSLVVDNRRYVSNEEKTTSNHLSTSEETDSIVTECTNESNRFYDDDNDKTIFDDNLHNYFNCLLTETKCELMDKVRKDTKDVHRQLEMHMNNFECFLEKELTKMSEENDIRWDCLMSAASYQDQEQRDFEKRGDSNTNLSA